MKKKINKPMRAAGVLLVATMLSTCLTAGTFAKYTTTDSATDSARVAKFGVTVAVNGSLFGEEYQGPAGNTPINWSGIYTDGTDGKGIGTVQVLTQGTAPNANNVVAPGTQNDTGMGFSVKGKPEVDCTVDINIQAKNIYLKSGDYAVMQTKYFADSDEYVKARTKNNIYLYNGGTWTLQTTADAFDPAATYCIIKDQAAVADFNGAEYYYPVQYTATDKRTGGTVLTKNQKDDSLTYIVDQMVNMRDTTAPFTNNTGVVGYRNATFKTWTQQANRAFDDDFPQEVLTWKWVYEAGGEDTAKYDKLDTILGDLVAQDGLAENPDILFTKTPSKSTGPEDIKCTVVKLDGTVYKIPTKATASDANPSSGDYIGAITADGDYNLYTAVYFKATATQVD